MEHPCPACKQAFESERALVLHRLTYHDCRTVSLVYGCGPVRVMAVAQGYAMCRRKGAMPFVVSLKELLAGV